MVRLEPLTPFFSLHAKISKALFSKKRLYCAFIDFKKAFDCIDRKKKMALKKDFLVLFNHCIFMFRVVFL